MASCKLKYLAKWHFFMVYFNILKSKVLVHWIGPTAWFGRGVLYLEVRRIFLKEESVTPMNFVLESFSSTSSTISLLASLRTIIRRLNWAPRQQDEQRNWVSFPLLTHTKRFLVTAGGDWRGKGIILLNTVNLWTVNTRTQHNLLSLTQQ